MSHSPLIVLNVISQLLLERDTNITGRIGLILLYQSLKINYNITGENVSKIRSYRFII